MEENCSKQAEQIRLMETQIDNALNELSGIRSSVAVLDSPKALEDIEQSIIQVTDRLAGLVTALKIQQAVASDELNAQGSELVACQPAKYVSQGVRPIAIQTSRGGPTEVLSRYYSRKHQRQRYRRATGDIQGLHPALLLIGIFNRCTPMMASEVAKLAAMLSSFEEVENEFRHRSIDIGVNRIRRIVECFANNAKASQKIEERVTTGSLGKRLVVVSTDGGRIRIRKNKRGPRTAKGRRRYSTKWREPKLLIIYTVDETGKMDRSFAPFIEGTLHGPDAIFGLIQFHLRRLSVHLAEKILFVADGARWIWNRVPQLFRELGIPADKVYELIDFYHAVEHLVKISELKTAWTVSERRQWVKRQRHLLLKGGTEKVIKAIKAICRGRVSKKLATERDYFVRNCHRMSYQFVAARGLPKGSGAVESTIRRVVNLRLKGASIYWLEQTAEAMLMLRCYYKAGRWDLLKNLCYANRLVTAG